MRETAFVCVMSGEIGRKKGRISVYVVCECVRVV